MFVFHNIFVFLAIAFVKGSDIHEYFVDQGENLTLPCPQRGSGSIMWVREGREDKQIDRLTIEPDGSLFLQEVNRNDSGFYSCFVDDEDFDNETRSKVKVKVRTTPPALIDVKIHPSTILALILWQVEDNGGYPIIYFSAQYKLAYSNHTWIPISPIHISPNSRQIDVYKLQPNTTYAFRIWAANQLGEGEITEVESKTLKVYEEIEHVSLFDVMSNPTLQSFGKKNNVIDVQNCPERGNINFRQNPTQLEQSKVLEFLKLARHFLEGAEKFDTRIWVAAVSIVMGTLTFLGLGTCYLLYLECRAPSAEQNDEQEIIELVPNIILNPGFEDNTQHIEHLPADENSNNESTIRLNNNTVVQPRNV